MASGGIYLLGVVMIFIALGGLAYYFNIEGAQQQVQAVKGFIEDSKCFPDGSCVTVLITEQPESNGVGNEIEIEKTKIVDGEYVTENEVITVQKQEDIPQVKKNLPSGVVVQGYVILYDAVTGNPIKPYVYNVMVQIECDEELNLHEGFNYCATKPIFGRVTTDDAGTDKNGAPKGGYFKYVWHPKLQDSESFYDVTVLVTSDQKNTNGQYDNYENSYKVQVID